MFWEPAAGGTAGEERTTGAAWLCIDTGVVEVGVMLETGDGVAAKVGDGV